MLARAPLTQGRQIAFFVSWNTSRRLWNQYVFVGWRPEKFRLEIQAMINALVRLILLGFVISVVARLSLLAFLVSMFANGGWGSGGEAVPLVAKSWCLGLVTQVEAREAMGNSGALRQIPPIRQQFIERNCQAYGLRTP